MVEGGEPRPILDFRAEADGPVSSRCCSTSAAACGSAPRPSTRGRPRGICFSALRPARRGGGLRFDTQLERVTRLHVRLRGARGGARPGRSAVRADVAVRRDRGDGAGGGRQPSAGRQAAAAQRGRGVDRRHRHAQPADAGAGLGDRERDRRAGLHRRGDVADRRPAECGLRRPGRSSSGALRNLARWTGGELFIASAPAHASIAARQIVDELRHQYLIAFEASARSGLAPAGGPGARSGPHRARPQRVYAAGVAVPGRRQRSERVVTEVDMVSSFAI